MEERATYGQQPKYQPPETFRQMSDQGMLPGLDAEVMAAITECTRQASLTGRTAELTVKIKFKPTTLKESRHGQQMEIIHAVGTKLPKLDLPKGSAFVTPTLQLSLHPHRVEPLPLLRVEAGSTGT